MNSLWGSGDTDEEEVVQPVESQIEELDSEADDAVEIEAEVSEPEVAAMVTPDDGMIRIRYLDSGKVAKVTATVFGELRRRGRRIERVK